MRQHGGRGAVVRGGKRGQGHNLVLVVGLVVEVVDEEPGIEPAHGMSNEVDLDGRRVLGRGKLVDVVQNVVVQGQCSGGDVCKGRDLGYEDVLTLVR